jgi:hypothetical protein
MGCIRSCQSARSEATAIAGINTRQQPRIAAACRMGFAMGNGSIAEKILARIVRFWKVTQAVNKILFGKTDLRAVPPRLGQCQRQSSGRHGLVGRGSSSPIFQLL